MTGKIDQQQARRALHEIDRLIDDAGVQGLRVESWISQIADELRAAMPAITPEAVALLARDILADPARSLSAQARLDRARIRDLSD